MFITVLQGFKLTSKRLINFSCGRRTRGIRHEMFKSRSQKNIFFYWMRYGVKSAWKFLSTKKRQSERKLIQLILNEKIWFPHWTNISNEHFIIYARHFEWRLNTFLKTVCLLLNFEELCSKIEISRIVVRKSFSSWFILCS